MLAALMMLGATMFLASMHGLVRLVSSDLHPFVIVFFRNLFGSLALLPILFKHGFGVFNTNNKRIHSFRALVGICAMLCFFYGLAKVPLANATALSFSTTLFAALFAALFLKERIRSKRIIAILVGFMGVLIVLNPNINDFNAYSLLIVLAAVSWGGSVAIVKRLTRDESSITIVSIMSLSLTLLSIVPALLFWKTPTLTQLFYLCLIGALATSGHLLMTESLKRSEVATVMSIDFARLIWTALIGVWLFSENIELRTVLGAVIIFGAGWYVVFRESKVAKKPPPLPLSDQAGG